MPRDKVLFLTPGAPGEYDPTRHNYYAKVAPLLATLPPTGLTEVQILHDDWCAIHKGGYCDCDPDVRVIPGRTNG